MPTTEKIPTTKEIIKKNFDKLEVKDDFELRDVLSGYGITVCMVAKQYYKPGTEEYKELYGALFNKASKMYNKALSGTREYEVELEYRAKHGKEWYGYSHSGITERNEEEVMERIKQRKYYSLRTNRKISPIFRNIVIKRRSDV